MRPLADFGRMVDRDLEQLTGKKPRQFNSRERQLIDTLINQHNRRHNGSAVAAADIAEALKVMNGATPQTH